MNLTDSSARGHTNTTNGEPDPRTARGGSGAGGEKRAAPGKDRTERPEFPLEEAASLLRQAGLLPPPDGVEGVGLSREGMEELARLVGHFLTGARTGTGLGHGSGVLAMGPHYDPATRTLFWNGEAIKWLGRANTNQEVVLLAFQDQSWPEEIADPLPKDRYTNAQRRRSETLRALNGSLPAGTIEFHANGRGSGICWKAASPPGE